MNIPLPTQKSTKFPTHQYEEENMVSYMTPKVKINWWLKTTTISNTEMREKFSCGCSLKRVRH